MEFFATFVALGNRGLRSFKLTENIRPRTFQQIEVEVSLVWSLFPVPLQGFFEVA
jgi:hypothetical protein